MFAPDQDQEFHRHIFVFFIFNYFALFSDIPTMFQSFMNTVLHYKTYLRIEVYMCIIVAIVEM